MKISFNETDLVKIVDVLEAQFKKQNELSMYRDIHEHLSLENKFAGDDHVFSIYDKASNAFYFVISPFDVSSSKAPQQALVFKDGVVTDNFDYSSYANMRTGAMDALLLRSLGRDIGKIVIFGTGSIAQWSVRFLKAAFPEIITIDYINRSGVQDLKFEEFGGEYDVTLSLSGKSRLGEYSTILLHTSSNEPVLTETDLEYISPQAVITSYLTSYDFEEMEDSYWDTQKNTIVVSWDHEIENSKDLMRAKLKGMLDESKLVTLKQVIDGTVSLPAEGRIVFRSAGTPIQNATMIKYLLNEKDENV